MADGAAFTKAGAVPASTNAIRRAPRAPVVRVSKPFLALAWLVERPGDRWFCAQGDTVLFGTAADAAAFKQRLMNALPPERRTRSGEPERVKEGGKHVDPRERASRTTTGFQNL